MLTKKGGAAKSICGFGSVKWRVGGTSPCSRARTALTNPATPAAASRWPTLVLTDPRAQYPLRRTSPNARVRAATSTGSPSSVPLPCASTYPTVSGSTPAIASASSTTSACPSTLGAVKPTFCAPSLLMAEPRITARTGSPSASASASRRSTTTPIPLPPTVPAARASKARQYPSGDVIPPGV